MTRLKSRRRVKFSYSWRPGGGRGTRTDLSLQLWLGILGHKIGGTVQLSYTPVLILWFGHSSRICGGFNLEPSPLAVIIMSTASTHHLTPEERVQLITAAIEGTLLAPIAHMMSLD